MQCKQEEQVVNIPQTIFQHMSACRRLMRIIICALGLVFIMPTESFAEKSQQYFESPQAGSSRIDKSRESNDQLALRAIFGSEGSKLLGSGDAGR